MSKDLYDIVADKVIEFCEKTCYYDCLVKFDISYDKKEWESVTCVIECDVNHNIVFEWDFCEGQKYIRNFRICHTDEAEIVKIAHWTYDGKHWICTACKNIAPCDRDGEYIFSPYCHSCGARICEVKNDRP